MHTSPGPTQRTHVSEPVSDAAVSRSCIMCQKADLTFSRSRESSRPISNSRNKTPSSDSFSISVMFRNNLQRHTRQATTEHSKAQTVRAW